MPNEIPAPLRELAELQDGVVSRRQARSAGLSKDLIRSRVDRGRWRQLHTGVYAVFTGTPSRGATLWAAVLRAGQGAMLSYQTAAELDGLIDGPSSFIHVTIPAGRRITAVPDIIVHVKLGAERSRHPSRLPPRTRVEETVLDLAESCDQPGDAIGWVTRALGRRLTSQDRLSAAMDQRSRLRWRFEVATVLSPDLAGLHSALEHRYLRSVEMAHGLPKGRRQAKVSRNGRVEYRDVLYEEYALAVELDGQVAHPAETRWLDIRRDNAAAADGVTTLRYGWREVTTTPCLVAVQVARALRLRSWPGTPRACSSGCQVEHEMLPRPISRRI